MCFLWCLLWTLSSGPVQSLSWATKLGPWALLDLHWVLNNGMQGDLRVHTSQKPPKTHSPG